jgi:dihydropteroate synthase
LLDRNQFTISYPDGASLALGVHTCVMGIINATPDSFSDGGKFTSVAAAVDAAARMIEQGAGIIDIGGESTRPGADPVEESVEADRVLPIIEGLKQLTGARVSIDTVKASVARQALDAGADMVNDITALGDPDMLPLIIERRAPVVIMHMRGMPKTMQQRTDYDDLYSSVTEFLKDRAESATLEGVADDKILLDPGIGFGKSTTGNMALLRKLPGLAALGWPILIGASRKSFIGAALGLPVNERLEGSLAVAAYACAQGAHMIRTHDVGATVRVVQMIDAIRAA